MATKDKEEVKKFDARKEIEKAVKEQANSSYAIELDLSPEDAEQFEYLSHWRTKDNRLYRVVARLKKGDNIKVQLLKINTPVSNA